MSKSRTIFLHDRGYQALVILTSLLCLALLQIPLIQDGDYEYAEALTLWLFPVSGILAVRFHKRGLSFVQSTLFVQPIAMIGLVVLFLNGCDCSVSRGLFFYALLPLPAAQIGLITGWITADLTGPRALWTLIVVWIVTLIVQVGWVIWFAPISVYSVAWGYFAGPIYDEWIPMDERLFAYRIWSIAIVAWLGALWALKRNGFSPTRMTAFVISCLCALAGWNWSDGIGAVSYQRLREILPQTSQNGLITVHATGHADSSAGIRLSRLADFHYSAMIKSLDVANPPPVEIYLYDDEIQKKIYFGAGATNFAKIWNHEIHINLEDGESTIKHELVHVLSTTFGNRWYGTAKIGLLEGLAVAIDWKGDNFTPHEWSAMLLRREKLPRVESLLDGSAFFSGSVSIGYNVAGSFVRFLMDSMQVDKVKFLFGGQPFVEVFGYEQRLAVERWHAFLRTIPLDSSQTKLADIMLERGVLQRECLHAVADRINEANHYLQRGEHDAAGLLFEEAAALSPDDPRLLLRKWRTDFVAGKPTEIDTHRITRFPFHLQFGARLLSVDQAIVNGQREQAFHELETAGWLNPGLLQFDRALAYRRLILERLTTQEADSLLRLGSGIDKISFGYISSPEVRVWSAAAAIGKSNFAYADSLLMGLTAVGDRTTEELRLECLARSAFEMGRTEAAITFGRDLVKSLGSKARAEQWKERIAFWEWLIAHR